MKRTAEEAAETRARVLASAIEVFTAEGYGAASAERIASAAGVTRGALYHHFKHKRELFIAAYDKLNEEFELFIGEQAERQPDARSALLAIANSWLVFTSRPSYRAIAVRDAPLVFGEAGVEPTNRHPGSELVRGFVASSSRAGATVDPFLVAALMGALRELSAEFTRSSHLGTTSRRRALAAFSAIVDGLGSADAPSKSGVYASIPDPAEDAAPAPKRAGQKSRARAG